MRDRIAALFGIAASSSLLDEALTHPSYANEVRSARHYQRLEFLGDAVLGLCASRLLYTHFPEADEGSLTRMRASLVNADALAGWARDKGLGEALLLGRGAESSGLRESTNVLADLVEALVAVAYLEGGIDAAEVACRGILEPSLLALEADAGRDPKSELQERVQKSGGPAPVYEVVESGGSAHDPWFVVMVQVGGKKLAEGRGRSKRLAERAAAAAALVAEGAKQPGSGEGDDS
jgi:ribonuclease-3